MATMPEQKPGRSKQDYATPPEFVEAVARCVGASLGPSRTGFAIDLAASAANSKGRVFYSEEDDSLVQPWAAALGAAWGWLNPPFAQIGPWVKKCAMEAERGAKVAVLLPSGVGTEWFAAFVARRAHVLFVRPRLTFMGETTPYPKDLMVCLYNRPFHGYDTWRWR
jgi:phage N-6-adenine-methyltransferase